MAGVMLGGFRPNPKQIEFFKSEARFTAYGGARGGGKAQPLDEPVLTPFGFRRMGDMKVGSIVCNPDGGTSRVIQIHPQGVRQIYKLTLASGAETRCTLDHLWNVILNGSDYMTIPLAAIIEIYQFVEVLIPACESKDGWILSYVTNIEPCGEAECQCITVDNPNGLYITKDFIVTHNSWAMRRKFILLALRYSDLKLLLLRRTFAELEGNHIRPLQAELNGIAKYNSEQRLFRFPNGSIIKLGFCDSDKDVFQYQGQEYDVIGFEEATQFTEYQMEFIKTSNRNVRTDFKPRIYYTCNPGGVGHEYIKRLFIDRNYKKTENPDDYCFIKATVYDNYALMTANPEYVSNLESLPEHLRRAFLNGDWDVVEGQFFSEFSREIHVVDPFPIPLAWKRFRSMDWGYNDPCAVYWHAVAPDRRIYTYKEIYQNQTLAADMAKLILQMDGKDKISYTVASPDTWQKRGLKDAMGGECIADTFCRMKVPLIKADNDRKNGWQRMRENLAIAPDGKPYWQIFSNCTNLIRTIPVAFYDQHDHEDVSANCEDHGIESTRYAMMSRPSPARIKPNAETAAYQYNPLSPPPKRKESGFLNL